MPRPAFFALLPAVCLVLTPPRASALAEDPAASSMGRASAKSAPRLASSRVTSLLSAATPKYEPPKPAEQSAARARVDDVPANEIIRLSPYIVRERPLPRREEVATPRELEKMALQRYLGDEDGLDRGVLNLFTVKSLWKKLPVLGKYPLEGFSTNEERAMEMYKSEKKRAEWSYLQEMRQMMAPSSRPGAQPAPSAEPAP